MKKQNFKKLRPYLLLWSTQSLSSLGSGMTSYALVLWLYMKTGSALKTALLSVCSYAPYVVMSIFAGALSDRWDKKRTMLVCDLIAAMCTGISFVLVKSSLLQPWHIYLLNSLNGLMNTIQQPAGEVAATLLIPEEYYQKTSGLRSFSQSLNSILTPVFATALFAFTGIGGVMTIDLLTFFIAFAALLFFIKIPQYRLPQSGSESILALAKAGLGWLRRNRLILDLILFLSCINLVASMYDSALPAMILSRRNGGETALGIVNACVGAASLAGSLLVTFSPPPKNRVRAITLSLLISMSTENFMLAFGKTTLTWCIGAVMGWIFIPLMNANMDVIFRREIPVEMQGRVFSCRNTLQFFTIPIGLLTGGFLVDKVFEPFAASLSEDNRLLDIFGAEKGSGAAMLFFVIGIVGTAICLFFAAKLSRYNFSENGADDTNDT